MCQPHKRHHKLFGLIPCSTDHPDIVEIDGRLLHFDFQDRRILEASGNQFVEIATLERSWPDHIENLNGLIQFPGHILAIRKTLFGLKAHVENRTTASVVKWKFPWISDRLHIEGIGSFESPVRTKVIGRCGDGTREICLVIAAVWLIHRIASEPVG
ncbi:hypothetical protein ACFQ5Q_10855 [Luteolibacter ambystomatis]|uniref:hypothetical protein n=1 Tax=Luteolibacter ambystomatis TaxID=2824561 RepID=UPI00362CB586